MEANDVKPAEVFVQPPAPARTGDWMTLGKMAATLGVGAAIGLFLVPWIAKQFTSQQSHIQEQEKQATAFIQTEFLGVLKAINATEQKRVEVDTARNEIDRQEIVTTTRRNEELDDLTDVQRENNKEAARTNTNIERVLSVMETRQEIEKAEVESK